VVGLYRDLRVSYRRVCRVRRVIVSMHERIDRVHPREERKKMVLT
jgi:hypothetical protein